MTVNQTRMTLIGVFLGSLAIQALAFFWVSRRMWPEELQALILKLLAVYSVHLGVIAGGIFAQAKTRAPKASVVAAAGAILFAGLWNLLLVGRSLAFAMAQQDSVTDLIKYLETVGDYGSFLVVAALAFFFSKSAEKTAHPSR